jgi:transcriptional regulator with XRE-family HTH domain
MGVKEPLCILPLFHPLSTLFTQQIKQIPFALATEKALTIIFHTGKMILIVFNFVGFILMANGQLPNSCRSKDHLVKCIGSRLRVLRKTMRLPLKNLSKATDLSVSLLSRVENGFVMPSIPTLQRIAEYFKVDIGYFFKKDEARGFVITRQGKRNISFSRGEHSEKVIYGLELLAAGMENPFMEPCIVTEFAKSDEDIPLAKHDGQEFVYVLEGTLELTLGEKKFSLKRGDAAYFLGEIPHAGKTLSKKPARTLNVHLIPGTRIGTFPTAR